MLRNGLGLLLVFLLASKTVWSEEPARKQPLKQRVSPQVLREAMALPEYRGKAPESPHQLLDDLQKLSEKLRKTGDSEGADLLQRFIHEHELVTRRTSQYSDSGDGKLLIHIRAFEANPNDLRDRSLFDDMVATNLMKIQGEFEHLVTAGKARICAVPFLIEGESSVPIRRFSDGEFTVPVHDGKTATVEFRDYELELQVWPTVLGKDRVRMKIAALEGEGVGVGALRATTTEGVKCTNGTCELHWGEAAVLQSHSRPNKDHRLFVIIEATPRN